MHQAQRRDRAGAAFGALPSHSRSRTDRRHSQGERFDRDRADCRGHLQADRQSTGAEDPPRRSRRLDRAVSSSDQPRKTLTRPALRRVLMPVRLSTGDPGFEAEFRQLLTAKRESAADVDAVVAQIIEDVVARGDAALIDYTRRFDGVDLAAGGLRLTAREIADVAAAAAPETVAALRVAAERIESLHRRQLPAPIDYVDEVGVRLAARWRPLAAAGLFVPGGTAAYPSSVLMNAIPAKVAGVERLVMTVPTPGGVLNPLVLAAAQMLGIDEIYRVGGAQAIAALAYGTAMIAPVDKIVGPGNAYVAAAPRPR